MKRKATKETKQIFVKLTFALVVWAFILGALILPYNTTSAAGEQALIDPHAQMYRRPAPNFDLNETRNLANLRQVTTAQLDALNNLKASTNASNVTVRWNEFGGSPDAIYDFASQPFAGTPEEAGRAFLNQNAALFGISDLNNVRVFSEKEALGGHLIRFQQTFNGIPVANGGIGIVMNANKQVIMASGPFFRDVAVNTAPTLSPEQAKQAAAADLQQFHVALPDAVMNLLQTGLSNLTAQAAPIENLEPQLGVYPMADGYRLVYKVAKFSTNPFGLYMISVDAHTGEIVARRDFVNYQAQGALPFTADIYPKYPTITDELKNKGIISVCNGIPCGQERVTLRKFDAQNVTTGLNGTLTGTNTVVNNALATKQPFAQAALGTWHFRNNDPTKFEARTNEIDQFAEPAEHQDEINAFFFTTYLLEYVDNLHIGSDNGTFGSQGSFPDNYPNKTTPLPATVHIPNVLVALTPASIPQPTDPEFAQKILGLDNAFALNLTSIIEGVTATKSPVVVNPTSYGHGYFFNDLALEGTVPYHEGMHAITSPIAGLEGTEGGALNEGQADMWAFTITDNPSLGDYVVNAFKYRQRFRDLNRNPDSVAYIRSANSTLKYSDIATLVDRTTGQPDFEEHYDGEIYMSTMWDIRTMLNRMYPQTTFKRPRASDGKAEKVITKGTHIFERDFLGSMYILGTTAPDTLVKSRDAMIVADQMLYPTDSTDADSPGKHRAMIEQLFAAKELGVNAVEVTGGKATISTQVTPFAGEQAAPATPADVQVAPASARTNRISWNGVSGALAYEVLKRKTAFANRREPNGKREYADGDASTTGFRHVAYVNANELSYEDKGKVQEVFAPAGLNNLFDSEYVVRAIGVNSTGQLGFSAFSGSSLPSTAKQELTAQIDSAISNISFANGMTTFDNKLTNARGAFSTDKTIYSPLEFQIVSISNPTVTVKNADANGNTFIYNQTLALGSTSNAKRFEFNNPMTQLFTFDAKIFGNAFAGSTTGTGTQTGDGTSNPPAPVTYSIYNETKTGTLVGGEPTATGGESATWGKPEFKGITWDDVEITTKSDALVLEASLSSLTAVDLDFEILTLDGKSLGTSAGATATEFISTAVQPNTRYLMRVKGFANGPSSFQIVTNQLLPNNSPNANAGTRTAGSGATSGTTAPTATVSKLVRFTVNPLTKSVTAQILQ
jgi:Zn-dependent metalloprotease